MNYSMIDTHSISDRGLEGYARMEYRDESPRHMAYQLEGSAPPTDSMIRMRERSVLLNIGCKAHGYLASSCLSVFAVIGCLMFFLQFDVLFL